LLCTLTRLTRLLAVWLQHSWGIGFPPAPLARQPWKLMTTILPRSVRASALHRRALTPQLQRARAARTPVLLPRALSSYLPLTTRRLRHVYSQVSPRGRQALTGRFHWEDRQPRTCTRHTRAATRTVTLGLGRSVCADYKNPKIRSDCKNSKIRDLQSPVRKAGVTSTPIRDAMILIRRIQITRRKLRAVLTYPRFHRLSAA
jgi:hypothetical protein